MSKNVIICITTILIVLLFVSSTNSSSAFLKVQNTVIKNKFQSLIQEKSTESEMEIKETSAIEGLCFLNSNGTVYDLNPLYNSTIDYTSKDDKYTMHYNFCQKAKTQCTQKNTTAFAVIVDNKNPSNCYSLGGEKSTLSNWKILSKKLF
jgi:hypothetical protein